MLLETLTAGSQLAGALGGSGMFGGGGKVSSQKADSAAYTGSSFAPVSITHVGNSSLLIMAGLVLLFVLLRKGK